MASNVNQHNQLLQLFAAYAKRLDKLYDDFVNRLIASLPYSEDEVWERLATDPLFRFDELPYLSARLQHIFDDYVNKQVLCYKAGITDGVALAFSQDKINLGKYTILQDEAIKAARNAAVASFIANRMSRKEGLSLSDKVWNYSQLGKSEVEMGISNVLKDGLKAGTSAEELGRKVRQYLNNPTMMYRRYWVTVADHAGSKKKVARWYRRHIDEKTGKVTFSDEPLEKVGMGVYRSARMNGYRLMRTEINMSYHKANASRWANEPFVRGIRVWKSPQHPKPDICDELEGYYPKDFVFEGWHPACYADGTKVLTARGWLPIQNVTYYDEVCSLNPKTLNIEYVHITDKQAYKKKCALLHFKGKGVDCLVTHDHRMIYADKKGNIRYKSASYFTERCGAFIISMFGLNGLCENFTVNPVLYDGMVYDLTLEKNHIMYVEHNGTCFWGSNCMCASAPVTLYGDEKREFYRRLMKGEDMSNFHSKEEITEENMNPNWKRYIETNHDAIFNAVKRNKLAYHLRDNQKYWLGEFSAAERKEMGLTVQNTLFSESERKAVVSFMNKYGLTVDDVELKNGCAMLKTDKAYESLYKEMALSKEDKAIVRKYAGKDFSWIINKKLRDGEALTTKESEFVSAFDAVFKKYKLPFGISVRRYVSLDSFNAMFGGEVGMSRKKVLENFVAKGGIMRSKGYLSTSTEKNLFFRDGLEIRMTLPKGSNVIVANNAKESEIILPRNIKTKIQNFIVDASRTADGKTQERVFIDSILTKKGRTEEEKQFLTNWWHAHKRVDALIRQARPLAAELKEYPLVGNWRVLQDAIDERNEHTLKTLLADKLMPKKLAYEKLITPEGLKWSEFVKNFTTEETAAWVQNQMTKIVREARKAKSVTEAINTLSVKGTERVYKNLVGAEKEAYNMLFERERRRMQDYYRFNNAKEKIDVGIDYIKKNISAVGGKAHIPTVNIADYYLDDAILMEGEARRVGNMVSNLEAIVNNSSYVAATKSPIIHQLYDGIKYAIQEYGLSVNVDDEIAKLESNITRLKKLAEKRAKEKSKKEAEKSASAKLAKIGSVKDIEKSFTTATKAIKKTSDEKAYYTKMCNEIEKNLTYRQGEKLPKSLQKAKDTLMGAIDWGVSDSMIERYFEAFKHKAAVLEAYDRQSQNGMRSRLGLLTERLSKQGITYREVEALDNLSEKQIIERICGGDLTDGSCSSLAFTYAGNKGGLDVLDFRGGKSRSFFSSKTNISEIVSHCGGTVVNRYDDFAAAKELFKKVEEGKEYYFAAGRHAAIIRQGENGLEYLELQSSRENGFRPFTSTTLKDRFGCKHSHKIRGYEYTVDAELVEISKLNRDRNFRKVLGYINTDLKKQYKGAHGTIK